MPMQNVQLRTRSESVRIAYENAANRQALTPAQLAIFNTIEDKLDMVAVPEAIYATDANGEQVALTYSNLASLSTVLLRTVSGGALAFTPRYDSTDATEYDLINRGAFENFHRRVFSVIDFGAKGDGVTNDFDAFQQAIIACNAAGGGSVYVPTGTYLFDISVPLLLMSNVTLQGVKGQSIIIGDVATAVPQSARPYPLAWGTIIGCGDPFTGNRAGVTTGGVGNGFVDPATIVKNVYIDGITVTSNFVKGVTPEFGSTYSINGMALTFCHRGDITDSAALNLPGNGIGAYYGKDNIVSRCRADHCGIGQSSYARNGISSTGWIDSQDKFLSSFSLLICDNLVTYCRDEGIQNGVFGGVIIANNSMIGNGDRGIEGDSAYNLPNVTSATYNQEVPGDVIITGNYIDGYNKEDDTYAKWGIGWQSSNEGRIFIQGNTIKNVKQFSGITAGQTTNGKIYVENNVIDSCDPVANFHQIYVNAAYAVIRNNTVINAGGTSTASTGISIVSTNSSNKYSEVSGNSLEGIWTFTTGITISHTTAVTDGIVKVHDNVINGTRGSAIIVTPAANSTYNCISIKNNVGVRLNSTANANGTLVTLNANGRLNIRVELFDVVNNSCQWLNIPNYGCSLANFEPRSVQVANVKYNRFGPVLVPFGKTALNDQTFQIVSKREFDNGMTGDIITMGTAAPNAGIWGRGDVVYNNNPAAAGFRGWACTTAGGAVAGAWTLSATYAVGTWRNNGVNVYRLNARTGAVPAVDAPVHTSGTVTGSDGYAWEYQTNVVAVFKGFGTLAA